MPLVGVATAAVALGEPLVGAQALGGCLVLVGVGLTAFPAANTTAKPAPAIGSPRRPLHTTGPARDAMA